jgi:hypothetical protein
MRPRYAALQEKGNRRSTVGVEVVSTTLGDADMHRVRGAEIQAPGTPTKYRICGFDAN